MTWKHVFIIIASITAVVICGVTNSCSSHFADIKEAASLAIVGAMAHARINPKDEGKKEIAQ